MVGTAPNRELILANHHFPGEYTVKAFGPGLAAFYNQVRKCATDVIGDDREFACVERKSSRGSRMCVTVSFIAETVDEVIEVYDRLHRLPDLMFIL